jgi:hypothetical protein
MELVSYCSVLKEQAVFILAVVSCRFLCSVSAHLPNYAVRNTITVILKAESTSSCTQLYSADTNTLALACMCVSDLVGTYPEGCYSFQGLDDRVGGGKGSRRDVRPVD